MAAVLAELHGAAYPQEAELPESLGQPPSHRLAWSRSSVERTRTEGTRRNLPLSLDSGFGASDQTRLN